MSEPLDLRAVAAMIAELRSQSDCDRREMPTRDSWGIERNAATLLESSLAHARALRAALQECKDHLVAGCFNEDGCRKAVERAAAVLAQGRDE